MRERNFERNIEEREAEKEQLESLPFLLRFDFSNKCNIRCIFCPDKPAESHFIPNKYIEQLEDVYPLVKKIWLFGWGEPLLHPDYPGISKYLVSFGPDVCFLTNGQKITDSVAREMVENRIAHVRISIDAATAETYHKLRKGGDFTKLINAVRAINHWKEKLGADRPTLGFNFIAMKDNIIELPELVRFARSLNVLDVGVAYLKVMFYEHMDKSLYFHRELSDSVMKEALSTSADTGVRLVLPPLFSDSGDNRVLAGMKCTEPWSTAFVRHDGTINACCANRIDMGSLEQNSFLEIWNGSKYRELRRLVNTDSAPELCKRCVDNQQNFHVNNPLSHFNKGFWERYKLEKGGKE